MKKFLSILLLLIVACGSFAIMAAKLPAASTVTKTYNVGDFDRIDVSVFDVEVRIGAPTGKAILTFPEKYADNIRVDVKSKTLQIGVERSKDIKTKDFKAVITVPTLRSIEASAAAKVDVTGEIRTPEFKVDLSSAASVNIPAVIADSKLEAELSSASSLNVDKASAPKFEADLSSAASCTFGTLTAGKAEIEASSASTIKISDGTADSVDVKTSSTAGAKIKGLKAKTGTLAASSCSTIKASVANPTSVKSSSMAHISL